MGRPFNWILWLLAFRKANHRRIFWIIGRKKFQRLAGRLQVAVPRQGQFSLLPLRPDAVNPGLFQEERVFGLDLERERSPSSEKRSVTRFWEDVGILKSLLSPIGSKVKRVVSTTSVFPS